MELGHADFVKWLLDHAPREGNMVDPMVMGFVSASAKSMFRKKFVSND